MASLLWGGDAGAAENERLNSHVTAAEQGRAHGRELEQGLPREVPWEGERLSGVWSGVSGDGGGVGRGGRTTGKDPPRGRADLGFERAKTPGNSDRGHSCWSYLY